MGVMLRVTNPVTNATDILDLYENENISMNLLFQKLTDIEVRGDFSRQFRVPATDKNIAVLGPLFDTNYDGNFAFQKKAPAEITVDTLPSRRGYIQPLRVYMQRGDQLADYELSFNAEVPDLARSIGAKKISELDFTDLAHDISFDSVTNGGTDWKYALSDRGQKWTENGLQATRSVLSVDNPVYPNELTLLVRWLWIFEKILSDAGFTYTGSTLAASLSSIWMPFVKSLTNSVGTPDQSYFFNVGLSADQPGFNAGGSVGGGGGLLVPSMAEIFDNNNDFASNVWTAPYTGFFTFRAWATIDPFSFPNNELAHLTIKRITPTVSVIKSHTITVPDGNIRHAQLNTDPVFCLQGETFGLYIGLSDGLVALGVTLKSDPTNDPANGTGWSMTAAQSPIAGLPISYPSNCPDYTQLDFIKDIVKMHNLAVIADNDIPNKLNFIPIPEYTASGSVKDWTGKIDLSKDRMIEPTPQKRRLVWTYRAGSDAPSKLFEKLGRVYGDYIVDGYTDNDFTDGEMKVELSIASTPCTYINQSNIIIPKFVNESGEFQDPGPRAVYIMGTTGIAIYNDGTNIPEFADINLIGNYSEVNPDINDFDLNFAAEQPLHEITANPFNNLFNRFYRSYINELYSSQARLMEAYFNLTAVDILTFKFNDKIWIKDTYWRVLEIVDYGVNTGVSTKVKLVKILGNTVDCSVVPYSVGRNGIIIWHNADGDVEEGTEDCCNRYGYQWNSNDSTCRTLAGNANPTPGSGGVAIGRETSPGQQLLRSTIADGSGIQSLITGTNINVGSSNAGSLIFADTVTVGDNIGRVVIAGTNVVASISGIHRGGGFAGGLRSEATGSAQAGSVILSGEGLFWSDGDSIDIDSQGAHINIPDNSTLSVELRCVLHRYSATSGRIIQSHYATFAALITKTGGVAGVRQQYTIFQDGNFGILSVGIDVATNTAQHRMSIISQSASSYAIDNIRITADLSYSQVVTSNIDIQSFKQLIKETEIMDLFIQESPIWEELSAVTSVYAPVRVSYSSFSIFASAVADAQAAMAAANALGSPNPWTYVITTIFYDGGATAWTFIMELQ